MTNWIIFAREPDVKEGEPPGTVAPPLWPLIVALPAFTGGLWACLVT